MLVELLRALVQQQVDRRSGVIRDAHGRDSMKARISSMVSSGALRFGQWPVAFITTSRLPGRWRCTYSPTAMGAITSSEHCNTSDGVSTQRRSSRLSDKKVTRAKWDAIS